VNFANGELGRLRHARRRSNMEVSLEHPAEEIKRLQRCINDLVSLLALPAMWSGSKPCDIVHTLLDSLLRLVDLDFVYVSLANPVDAAPSETIKVAQSQEQMFRPQELCTFLNRWLGDDPQKRYLQERSHIGDEEVSLVSWPLGVQLEIGVIVAGSRRADFPRDTEALLLGIAANQALIGLQQARLLTEQKRVADELDQSVAQRTAELAAANEVLKKEVAERRRAEDALKRSEAFLAEGQRLSRVGSFSWRLDTDEITFSEELYRIFELDCDAPVMLEQIVGRVHPEDIPLLSEKMDLARRNINDHDYAIRLRMPDGRVKYLRTKSYGIRDRDGRLEHVGAIQDATEHRLSEEALAKVSSELAHVTRVSSLGALTASIAHEINQPLSGIVTNASTCLRMLAADPPNVDGARETARRTIRDANRASDVITRLRALCSKKETTIESLDLNEAIREVIALSLSELQRNRVILRTELADDLPLVTGDRVQLQQVVLNLLRNASDAMSAVDDRPRRMVITTEREEGDRVRLTVQDAGVGLDPQAMDRLFEAFYTTKNEGMGMGLSVSRSIIERHHGRLWAAPNDGPGATFSFSIPCGPASATGARSLGVIGTPAAKDAKRVQGNP
jgi:C4-dicarboxylate-specific signal transduction histidine kinase